MRREVSTTEKIHHERQVSNTVKSQIERQVSTTEYFQSYEDPVDQNFIEVSTKKRVAVKWTEERKKKHAARMKARWEEYRAKKERKKQEDKEFWEDQTRRDLADTNPLEYVYNYDRNDPKNINPAGRNYTGFKPYIEHYTYLPTNATGNNVWYVDY
uniref:Uncharacterized protein n=1 Tax=Cacopsylla melanoneura TaxID=428564 RepID=A0A8D8QIA5_9HEMI